ncbi:hypothetical protein EDC30_12135 [Paucimonas lemoignei]|uniref:Uncharacterized protein n=1 Tax=Paucimonas lemoignei TaxID=29443 RepID=A0A4R3HS24_PAULE|nr:hypothetical protein [Paucimonas lemoignei]TCS32611.1 hypothetical protein EDC30_12135 [Paucimonas lemoignei]
MTQLDATELEKQYQYPESMQVYGIVVDDRLSNALIKLGLDALSQKKVDRLIFLCLDPHDIRERTDWTDIIAHIPATNGARPEYDVRIVQSPAELMHASLNMRVVRLPVDSVVI